MKTLREKFKQNVNFVQPLYKKVRTDNRVKPSKKIIFNVSNDTKLCGDEIYVKREIVKTESDFKVLNDKVSVFDRRLPSGYKRQHRKLGKSDFDVKLKLKKRHNVKRQRTMVPGEENGVSSKSMQADSVLVINKHRDYWLRVYPAVQIPGESVPSVILRCLVCQLGLATFLVLWTIAWVFVINYFEGPFETEVSIQFEKDQNQLVIDLATELRQIMPVSPKWRYAIEKRIEDERELTLRAVAQGAKLHPGPFWNLSGTFLFTVYVMTALGFGAPVPQTIWGRTSSLVYAALSVPMHIYLMVNFSTCVVANTEANLIKFKKFLRQKRLTINETSDLSTEMAKKRKRCLFRKRLVCLFNVLSIGRCVPLATITYYTVGAISFGVLRGRQPLETIMFPLEFTTTGGLEHVQNYVRILYGLYVEGAMILLACTLAALRRHNGAAVTVMSQKYRLFTKEK